MSSELVRTIALAIQRADDESGYDYNDFPNDPEISDWGIHLARAAIEASGLQALEEENARLREALTFYRDEWEQDVDAEQTVHGWTGTIGEVEPTASLLSDRGDKARAALEQTPQYRRR